MLSIFKRLFHHFGNQTSHFETKNFTAKHSNISSLRVQAIHEVSHAVAMSMYFNGAYRSVEQKKIKLHKNTPSKDPHFKYLRPEDSSSCAELYIDILVCLAGFVGELEYLNTDNTNAIKDMEDWHLSLRWWLLHYNSDYIAHTNSEEEIKWNNKIINRHKHRQTMMLRKILASNKEVVMDYVELLISKNYLDNDDINDMLDRIEIPISAEMEFNNIMKEAKLTWH